MKKYPSKTSLASGDGVFPLASCKHIFGFYYNSRTTTIIPLPTTQNFFLTEYGGSDTILKVIFCQRYV